MIVLLRIKSELDSHKILSVNCKNLMSVNCKKFEYIAAFYHIEQKKTMNTVQYNLQFSAISFGK